jgi:hypothetical protein
MGYLPMSMPTHEELLKRFAPVDDPEIMARRKRILRALLESEAQLEGRLIQVRANLRRVLVLRQLTPRKQDNARIEACTELATLRRWFDQAVTAVSVADALG